MTPVWLRFGHQFWVLLITINWLASCYLLICYSNGFALLIKVGEQAEFSKLQFWLNVQFCPEKAQNRLPRQPLRCTPRARGNASTSGTCSGRVHHAQSTSTMAEGCHRVSHAPAILKWMLRRPLSLFLTSSALSIAIHTLWASSRACSAMAAQLAMLLLWPRGHDQGLAAPSLACTNRRWPKPKALPSPLFVVPCLLSSFVVWKKKEGSRVEIWNNSGFQMRSQDLYE